MLELRDKAKICDFCKMLWAACEKFGATQDLSVRFERVGSILRIKMRGGSEKPALSICCSSRELCKLSFPTQSLLIHLSSKNAGADPGWIASTSGRCERDFLSNIKNVALNL